MRLATYQSGKVGILYDATSLCDAEQVPQIGADLLDPEYWQRQELVVGQAPGRGQSLFLNVGEQQWVLRPYRRGGLIARLSSDRYTWTGLQRTRAFREMRLTATLHDAGLPVPRPILAGVERNGLSYRAALITQRLPQTIALAEHLTHSPLDVPLLEEVGRVIRRFHDHGLDHVDLNARNLLIDDQQAVWLIDLDRCRLRSPGRWRQSNLERLQRSFQRFCPEQASAAMKAVKHGYDNEHNDSKHSLTS
ncbi:3-deoxy-D-manno-octulosonic acid kinase [Halomonas huangheensis]|uniref:3-deoxy-D-manno-octulosonic acid kinase n=1 Tax=Halomonas huangheensis TaxID=1178482 RepID=W1N607_9GAMM|nr:3-deoxy-D-manno-octulosonic acid kinase [Halomonas huangheensis]ALM50875.1 3-deoxy-D-manno-octulosonic acid kinase [Halomonas huangheensis]ERL51012.1 hypothetical protein BJB45_20685 [Halomonas huangheensis]